MEFSRRGSGSSLLASPCVITFEVARFDTARRVYPTEGVVRDTTTAGCDIFVYFSLALDWTFRM